MGLGLRGPVQRGRQRRGRRAGLGQRRGHGAGRVPDPRRRRRRRRPRKKRRGLVDESSDSSDDDDGAPPPGYAYCAVCRRDVHADSFSAAVLRGDYGYNMDEPYCLAHSPQDLRDYRASGEGGASRLQTTTLAEAAAAYPRTWPPTLDAAGAARLRRLVGLVGRRAAAAAPAPPRRRREPAAPLRFRRAYLMMSLRRPRPSAPSASRRSATRRRSRRRARTNSTRPAWRSRRRTTARRGASAAVLPRHSAARSAGPPSLKSSRRRRAVQVPNWPRARRLI